MYTGVIVLNSDYSYLGTVSIKKAFTYIAKGKVQVEKYIDKAFNTAEAVFKVPMIVRFLKLIRQVFKKKVPWSKKNILIRDNYTCQYCGQTKGRMSVDHVLPKSKGGKNTFENTVCACFDCNNSKDNRTPAEANMFLKSNPVQPTVSEFARSAGARANLPDIFKILGFSS